MGKRMYPPVREWKCNYDLWSAEEETKAYDNAVRTGSVGAIRGYHALKQNGCEYTRYARRSAYEKFHDGIVHALSTYAAGQADEFFPEKEEVSGG